MLQMSQLSNIFSGKDSFLDAISDNKQTIAIVVAVVCVLAGILYIYFSNKSDRSSEYKENSERVPTDGQANTVDLLFFHVDWCPHCKTALPAWEEVKAEYENTLINGRKVIFRSINCTDETAEISEYISKYKIEGYPTIKLIKDGNVIEYDAKPTVETIKEFLNTVV